MNPLYSQLIVKLQNVSQLQASDGTNAAPDLAFWVVIAAVGFLAGGIVNLLADDLPHYRKPRWPRYPDGERRPLVAWLGITAFAFGKQTSSTGSRLTRRYPLAEIATAAAMILTALVKANRPEVSGLQLVFYLSYMPIFVLITVIDIEHRLILYAVTVPTALLAILDAILTPVNREPNLTRALIGGLLGFGVFFLMYVGGILYVYLSNRRGANIQEVAFGFGDVMMATLSGLILGPEPLIFAMFITVILGALGALLFLIAKRASRAPEDQNGLAVALPYGPYIVIGTAIMVLFSAQVRLIIAGY